MPKLVLHAMGGHCVLDVGHFVDQVLDERAQLAQACLGRLQARRHIETRPHVIYGSDVCVRPRRLRHFTGG